MIIKGGPRSTANYSAGMGTAATVCAGMGTKALRRSGVVRSAETQTPPVSPQPGKCTLIIWLLLDGARYSRT